MPFLAQADGGRGKQDMTRSLFNQPVCFRFVVGLSSTIAGLYKLLQGQLYSIVKSEKIETISNHDDRSFQGHVPKLRLEL